ncbi:putative ATP-dependent RNA helicase DHX35-like [Tropilaelaps mercedesae]|uniref:Mitochondrial import inner membrane translocase subunit TIM44 n=1 Tax=Tropilaelaps mercedesae TaxID=418985 RepID=A0A1V9XTF6_9ACAR|nr:putative ATP-dependent RNA helicase DHX35-like [Tropilaelaps mercedesae]
MFRAAPLVLRQTSVPGRINGMELLPTTTTMALVPQRSMSKGGFFKTFYENLKQDLEKNKEMKENLKKFKEEAAKLEQSEALQKARRKFKAIESEASSSNIAENLQKLREQVGETIEKSRIGEEMSRTAEAAKRTIEGIAQKGDEILSKSDTLKAVSQSMEGDHIYRAPAVLLKRSALSAQNKDVVFEANDDAQGVELHRDSKWAQGWENFKNSNPYINKFMEMRTQLEESENPLVRASRAITNKMQDLFGGVFQITELSQVYTEILKIDPNFEKTQFLRMLERQIIPTVLEAMVRPDLEVLKDWMYEAPYSVLTTPIVMALKAGFVFDSRVLDISNVEIIMGKMMEEGPVLIVTFVSQKTQCVRDKSGKVVEGDPEKVMRFHNVWCFCRDPNELNPIAAWRILDLSMTANEQLI